MGILGNSGKWLKRQNKYDAQRFNTFNIRAHSMYSDKYLATVWVNLCISQWYCNRECQDFNEYCFSVYLLWEFESMTANKISRTK